MGDVFEYCWIDFARTFILHTMYLYLGILDLQSKDTSVLSTSFHEQFVPPMTGHILFLNTLVLTGCIKREWTTVDWVLGYFNIWYTNIIFMRSLETYLFNLFNLRWNLCNLLQLDAYHIYICVQLRNMIINVHCLVWLD